MEKLAAQLETKEVEKQPRFDTTIVFGQGPVKLLKISSELTPGEKEAWDKFKSDPKSMDEPDFYVLDKDPGIAKRQEWQHMGKFALKRLGRFNALAAGNALMKGYTGELIFSGGRTTNTTTRARFKEEYMRNDPLSSTLDPNEIEKKVDQYIKYMVRLPSEAELMADVVRRRYGEAYKKKYKRDIDEVLKIEDEATNTIENIVLIINKNPSILNKRVGLLTSNFHVNRARILANTFGIESTDEDKIGTQDFLDERAKSRKRFKYAELIKTELPEIVKAPEGETRLIRGLEEPQFLEYWLGFIGELENPAVLQQVLKKYQSEEWKNSMRASFEKVGLNFDDFNEKDLVKLSKDDPELYEEFRGKLMEFTFPGKRLVLPGPAIKN